MRESKAHYDNLYSSRVIVGCPKTFGGDGTQLSKERNPDGIVENAAGAEEDAEIARYTINTVGQLG